MPTTADAREEIVHLNPTVALGAGPDATDGPLAAGESPELRHDIGHFLFRQCAPRLSKLGFGFTRIAQIAPSAESSSESLRWDRKVVAWLVDKLVALGHDVTLFASGDSGKHGELHPVWPRALRRAPAGLIRDGNGHGRGGHLGP
jgi:hypothetical protein